MCVMAPFNRIPPADLRVLISHGCKWTRTCVILSKKQNADTLKNWRWLGYTSSVFGVEAVLAGKRETMCKLLKIAFSWFHGSCTRALRGPAAPWLHWLLRSGSHIGFKCLACREILPRWLWFCWCTSVTTCYYHKQLWCVFRSVPKSEKIHGTGPDLLESRSSPGGGGGFFWRWVGKRETKRPGMKWWAHRDDVVEQARELCEGHLQLTFLAWRWESCMCFVVPVYTYRYPVIQLVNTTRDSWSCISPSSNGEICPGASTGVINEDVLSRWPLATMLNYYLQRQRQKQEQI